MSTDLVSLLVAAAAPIPERERDVVVTGARQVLILALVDALEHPEDERPVAQGARGLMHGADSARVRVLVEGLAPARAHAVVEALARQGWIAPETARIAHASVDLPCDAC
jgi:hypothetical protein